MAFHWHLAQDSMRWMTGENADTARAVLRGDDQAAIVLSEDDELDVPDEMTALMTDPIFHIEPPTISKRKAAP